jgi:hypothetical protein
MTQIVQYSFDHSSVGRFKRLLRAIRVADLTSQQADQLWDEAHKSLEVSDAFTQHYRLAQVERQLTHLSQNGKPAC